VKVRERKKIKVGRKRTNHKRREELGRGKVEIDFGLILGPGVGTSARCRGLLHCRLRGG